MSAPQPATKSLLALIRRNQDYACVLAWKTILENMDFSSILTTTAGLTQTQISQLMLDNWPKAMDEKEKGAIKFAVTVDKLDPSLYKVSLVVKHISNTDVLNQPTKNPYYRYETGLFPKSMN